MFNLSWSDIDFKNRKINIVNSKNNECRIIPINQTLYEELSALSQRAQGDYVFTRKDGRPLKDVKKGFSSARKKAGINNFRFHDLRHIFASHLIMQGVDLSPVLQIMGNKDGKMTLRYSHLSPDYVPKAAEKLDLLWTLLGHQNEQDEEASFVTN